jgi:hypothetical protein
MTGAAARKSSCPQCGAPIQFRFSSAVQTVCEFCHSILVRRDLDLAKVGKVADLPLDSSPIQLRTEGIYNNKAFWVAGRILYQWEQGGWNEWHIVFQDGNSGWLSDAQAQYAVTFAQDAGGALPNVDELYQGRTFQFQGVDYQVTSITRASYVGVEGELPFEYWDKTVLTFADLRTGNGSFATIDYSENPPLLFIGESVDFDALQLKNLREFEGW